jgi:hypothetical protein
MYQPSQAYKYIPARRPLTTFGTTRLLNKLTFSCHYPRSPRVHHCKRHFVHAKFQ